MHRILWLASTHARVCLILGLAAGLALPGFAATLAPWLPQMVAGLLTITALRIGHRAAFGTFDGLHWALLAVLVLQMGLPLVLYALLWTFGLAGTPAALAIVLASAAPAITGGINLALLMRLDAGRMMQILVLGTAVFPLTILPVLLALPQLGNPVEIVKTALLLLFVIVVATGFGFGLRARLFPNPTEGQIKALDGLSVLAFSFIVVGLMAALTPALKENPAQVLGWMLLAFLIGYGLQAGALLAFRRGVPHALKGPLGIAAGNRNIAIFLVALPPEVLEPVMVFIGCWQVPMYLTPLLLPRFYAWVLSDD